jgi:hypothetical protein
MLVTLRRLSTCSRRFQYVVELRHVGLTPFWPWEGQVEVLVVAIAGLQPKRDAHPWCGLHALLNQYSTALLKHGYAGGQLEALI